MGPESPGCHTATAQDGDPAAALAPTGVAPAMKVLLVDDHPVTRQGVAALIQRQPDLGVCGEADNGAKAIELVTKLSPDLVIVDISLRTMSGIELIKNIRGVAPRLPILVMSMHDERVYAERALRAGAQGYVMKREASESVVVAVRRVLAGEIYLSDSMKERMLNRLAQGKRAEPDSLIDRLSDRELEVLQLIGGGFSTRQIAAQLNLSIKTVDSYREHLKAKLLLSDGSELVRFAIDWTKSQGA